MAVDLEETTSRLEIEAILMRYFRGVDRLDWGMIERCFHDDAEADYGAFGFTGGRTGFLEFLQQPDVLPAFERTMHFAGNVTIDFTGPDVAHCETYCIAHHRGTDAHAWGRNFALNWLRYIDRFERRGGDWAIARRRLLVEWGAMVPIEEWMEFPAGFLGRRDRADASYER